MTESPRISDLFKAKVVTDEDISAAAEAYVADPTQAVFLFGGGYRIDLSEAVKMHEWAAVTMSNNEAADHLKRAAVRTAILLARPAKG